MDLEEKYSWNSSYHLNKWCHFIYLWHGWIKVCLESWNYGYTDPLSNKFLGKDYKFSRVNQAHQLAELANREDLLLTGDKSTKVDCLVLWTTFSLVKLVVTLRHLIRENCYILMIFSVSATSANWIQTCFLNISNFTIFMITSKLYAKHHGQLLWKCIWSVFSMKKIREKNSLASWWIITKIQKDQRIMV